MKIDAWLIVLSLLVVVVAIAGYAAGMIFLSDPWAALALAQTLRSLGL